MLKILLANACIISTQFKKLLLKVFVQLRKLNSATRFYKSDGAKLCNWVLQGKNGDGDDWVDLKRHDNDASLSIVHSVAYWPLGGDNVTKTTYRQFRILQHGKNSTGDDHLMCFGIELYGALLDVSTATAYGTTQDMFELDQNTSCGLVHLSRVLYHSHSAVDEWYDIILQDVIQMSNSAQHQKAQADSGMGVVSTYNDS